jgi:hypothetical protein
MSSYPATYNKPQTVHFNSNLLTYTWCIIFHNTQTKTKTKCKLSIPITFFNIFLAINGS